MKNRKSPKQLRQALKRQRDFADTWIFSGPMMFGNMDANATVYFDTGTTSVTYPAGTFNGFNVGDIITISTGEGAKKKKKVHVARRRKQNREITHTITNVSDTSMTIAVNDTTTATKISDSGWSVTSSGGITI